MRQVSADVGNLPRASAAACANRVKLMRMSFSPHALAGGCLGAVSGHLFIADQYNNRIREVPIPGPALGLNNVATNNADGYDVVVWGPSGAIASSIATLRMLSAPLIDRAARNPDSSLTLSPWTLPASSSRVLAATNLELPVLGQPVCTNVAPASGPSFSLGSPITAAGVAATASDTMTNSQRFYRVIWLP